jgi:hypothetical protein
VADDRRLGRVTDATLSPLLAYLTFARIPIWPIRPEAFLRAFGVSARYVQRDAMLRVRDKPLILPSGAVGLGEHIPRKDRHDLMPMGGRMFALLTCSQKVECQMLLKLLNPENRELTDHMHIPAKTITHSG